MCHPALEVSESPQSVTCGLGYRLWSSITWVVARALIANCAFCEEPAICLYATGQKVSRRKEACEGDARYSTWQSCFLHFLCHANSGTSSLVGQKFHLGRAVVNLFIVIRKLEVELGPCSIHLRRGCPMRIECRSTCRSERSPLLNLHLKVARGVLEPTSEFQRLTQLLNLGWSYNDATLDYKTMTCVYVTCHVIHVRRYKENA